MNVKLRIKIAVYDKAITFIFECNETEVFVLERLAADINNKLRDAYYFDSIQVERV